MRCADLNMLLAILKERHREQFKAFERAVITYRAEVRKAHDEELLELQGTAERRRRSMA